MAKSLIELKTDLKSLKYQGVNGSEAPYVTKDIRVPESPSRVVQEFVRRVDDTVRIAKAISPVNSRFLENQAKLIQADNSQKLNPVRLNSDGTFLQRVANRAISIAGVAASTLAQVPLAGTGTRLGIAFRPTNGSVALAGNTVLPPDQLQESVLKTRESKIRNQEPTTYIDSQGVEQLVPFEDEPKSYYGAAVPYTGLSDRDLSYQAKSGTEIVVGNLDEITNLREQAKDSLVNTGNSGRFESESGAVIESYPFIVKDFAGKVNYTPLEVRYKSGTQGLPKKPTSYKTTLDSSIDKLNAVGIRKSKLEGSEDPSDLIKFYFTVMVPGQEDEFIYFRAYLDSFNDSYQGNWSETQYIGRGEKMQTYDGFSRSISLSFKIAASTRAEMKPLYRKIVTLASTTAPTYGGGTFMRGTLVKLTVGDYLAETPGVITSVDYKWETSYPWEVVLDKEEDQQQLPHILDCSINFRPIHDFIPVTGLKPFITNTAGSFKFLD